MPNFLTQADPSLFFGYGAVSRLEASPSSPPQSKRFEVRTIRLG
jgi:hypothetical protein